MELISPSHPSAFDISVRCMPTVKAIAQGRSDDPATPVVLPRATFYARGPRVRAGTRLPYALVIQEGTTEASTRGAG
jgi:hypothetical protein